MTAERRVERLEEALDPRTAVVLWLDEAHAHGSLSAYVRWLLDRPPSVGPYARIPERARAAARGSVTTGPGT